MRAFNQLFAFVLLFAAGLHGAESPRSAGTGTQPDYVLQPSDFIRVQIFQEDDLTRDVRISQEMSIMLPLIGSVTLGGKTVRQAEELVRSLYDRSYLVNPQINIIILEYGKRTVNVLGSVNTPGAVPFPAEQGLTLLDAVARAGGFSRLADRKRIKLTRTAADGHVETFIVNADELIQGSSREQWLLQKDDTLFVPERIL